MTEYEKLKIELIGIRKFLMNLQIRVLSIENKSFDMEAKEHEKGLEYPDPRHLMCPNCNSFQFKGSHPNDENDTIVVLWCESCGYQYSPSHD